MTQEPTPISGLPHLSPDEIVSAIKSTLEWEGECLQAMAGRIDHSIAVVVELLRKTTGRIVVTGMGKMGHVGRKASATWSSTGSPSLFLHPSEALHGDLGMVASGDILVALSNSGETAEVLALLPFMERSGVPVVAITGRPESTLGARSAAVVNISVDREADEISSAPTASTTVAMAVCDGLAVALMRARGFTRDEFAIFHPGGHLGRKMLTLVSDVMKTGRSVPVVPVQSELREAIVVMSERGLGCVFVVDDQGCLRGIFTDGDLRRSLSVQANPLLHKLSAYMISDPKTVSPTMLAAGALRLMEQHSITVVPVIDDQGIPVGALHLHDLVQLGLA